MENFENEIYKDTILQLARASDPVNENTTYDLNVLFGKNMDEEKLSMMNRALCEGNMLYFTYAGKEEALDMLYDLFELGVFQYPIFACLYSETVDKDPIEAESPEELTREDMHELMNSGQFGMCILDGYNNDGLLLPFAVMWSSYEDSTPEALILANTNHGPYPELGWLLACVLNIGQL